MPRYSTPYPDSDLDCQKALEESFRTLLDLAETAGWAKVDSAEALRELSLAYLAMEFENHNTEVAIAEAQARTATKH